MTIIEPAGTVANSNNGCLSPLGQWDFEVTLCSVLSALILSALADKGHVNTNSPGFVQVPAAEGGSERLLPAVPLDLRELGRPAADHPPGPSPPVRLWCAIIRWLDGRPALFEIRNTRDGALAPQGCLYHGTVADRVARQLGPDWRVFRHEETATRDLAALFEAIHRAGPAAGRVVR